MRVRRFLFLLPMLYMAISTHVTSVLTNFHWEWNACRIAPLVAWAHGYPLYSSADSGPIQNCLYGPLFYILYWPVTWFRRPTHLLLAGTLLTTVFYFVP